MNNQQLHKRLSEEQVIAILENYLAHEIKGREACLNLGIKKSRFFKLVAQYRDNSKKFTIKYQRAYANRKISQAAERKIITELKSDKKLIDNKNIPVNDYNYSAIKETLAEKHQVKISLPTIIDRAKKNGYYLPTKIKKIHDREVITNLAGELAQHDSSHHLWSPYMLKKLYLITTIDDYSRLILYADFMEQETAWAHILALKSVFLQYGCPLKYYPDQHSIFRFVKDRDKNRPCNLYAKFTDDVDTQWRQVLNDCKVSVIHALSPQAKGKVERPYRWLQDRIVRIAAKEKLTSINQLRKVLAELVWKYNTKWIHSTTKEIPIIRFENALKNNKSLFTPFKLTKTKQTIDDIFCLRMDRIVDSYRKVSVNGLELRVPNGRPRQTVNLKIAFDDKMKLIKVRFWQKDCFLGEVLDKLENLPIVHF